MKSNNIYTLLKSIDFNSAWEEYSNKHVIDENNESERIRAEYFFQQLLKSQPNMDILPSECTVFVEEVSDIFDENENEDEDYKYLDVFGKYPNDEKNYSLSYTDWSDILAYQYDLNSFSEAEFIFTLIDDVSFHGDEQSMVNFRGRIEQRIDEVESGDVKKMTGREFLNRLKLDDSYLETAQSIIDKLENEDKGKE